MSFIYVPSRLYILQKIQSLIEGAAWEDGTLAGKVSIGKLEIGDEVPVGPWVNIIESPRPDFAAYAGHDEARLDEWVILVSGSIERDDKGQSDPAYYLQAEIELQLSKIFLADARSGRATYPEIHDQFKGILVSLRANPPVIRPVENIMGRIAFYQPLTLGMAAQMSNPFTKVTV